MVKEKDSALREALSINLDRFAQYSVVGSTNVDYSQSQIIER